MPVSHPEGKDWLLTHYLDILPATVVDIGPGQGTYATRFRPHHAARWTGIEAWAPYLDEFGLRAKYDGLTVGDARTVDLPVADCYIAGDVLEHMPKADALALIGRIQAVTSHLLVSVPVVEILQGAVGGNSFETHHHHWQHDEMLDALNPSASWRGHVLGCYRWDKEPS